jgi:hypothetical protein
MSRLVYISRLTRLPLVGADGAVVGRVVDELFRRTFGGRRVLDAAIAPGHEPSAWELATAALDRGGLPGRRRAPEILDWSDAGPLLRDDRAEARQISSARRACSRRWRPTTPPTCWAS